MTISRIVLISAEYPPAPGGVGDYTACLAAALAAAGEDVHVLTSRRPNGAEVPHATGDSRGVTVHRIVDDWGWRCWGKLGPALEHLQPAVATIQYQTGAYRLHGAINLLPWRLRARPGLTWVTTFHDLREPYLFPKAGQVRRLANEALMRWSRALVVTNPQDEMALPAWAQARAVGIPIGANLAPAPPSGWDRAAWRTAHGVPSGATLIGYFGFFNVSKGLETLLTALATLRRGGDNYHLLLAGGGAGASDPTDAATMTALYGQIAALNLEPAVHITGYVPGAQVSAALLSADLAALPFLDGASFRRGSLLAVLAHGLPLVTTTPALTPPTPTPWPRLQDGTNAVLVPPDDAEALAAALARLAGDADARARLHSGALALAAEFGWAAIAARYQALFARLAAGPA